MPDGELAEWSLAASVPIRYASYVSRAFPKRAWRGPADAGMEVYCAWTEEGLCLAAQVADDDVFNDRKGETFWHCDCIEFHFDCRASDRIGSPTQELGVEHVYFRPPNGKYPAEAWVRPDNKISYDVKCAGKRTPIGYTAEILVPWSAFPDFKPEVGTAVGMQWVLTDRDSRDEQNYMFPQTLSYQGRQHLRVKPQDYVRFTLADTLSAEGTGMMFALDSPKALTDDAPATISVEACGGLASRIGAVKVTATDADGKLLLDTEIAMKPLPTPWDSSIGGKIDLLLAGMAASGYGTVETRIIDRHGEPIRTVSRPFMAARGVVDRYVARLEKADIPKLAKAEPYRAAAYMGVASCIERLERVLAAGQLSEVPVKIQEIEARFDVLEDGKLDGEYGGYLDLLALTGDPEAGVVVEYPSGGNPSILVTHGSFAVATVYVYDAESEESARKAVQPTAGSSVGISVEGFPGIIQTKRLVRMPSGPSAYNPNRRIMVVSPADRQALLSDVSLLTRGWSSDAVVCLPDCPSDIREAIEAFAKKRGQQLSDIDTALTKPTAIVAGDIKGTKLADLLKTYHIRAARYVDGLSGLAVAKGKRIIDVQAPTRKVAERAAELVAAGKPIKASDVDAMCRDLRDELAPKVALDSAPPRGQVFLGDTHLHTFYSDGVATPIELVLEGIYVNLDYMVITDHQEIKGGIEARRLLSEYGVRYPVTVGQEISVDNAAIHANAYPLKKIIGPIPPADAVREAHAQRAVIQWNHPGWPPSDWAFKYLNTGTDGTGFDAWEHYTDDIDRWEKMGIMPVVVGSTDNHSTHFAWGERTAIIAPSGEGADLADAIRNRKAAMVTQHQNGYLYGPDEMPYWIWRVLADGPSVKQTHAERITTALKDADIVGLLKASTPKKQ